MKGIILAGGSGTRIGYTFEKGIHETIQWYLEHTDWVERITSGDYQNYYHEMYDKAETPV